MSTKILIYPLKKCMCKELRERGLRPFFFAIKFSYFVVVSFIADRNRKCHNKNLKISSKTLFKISIVVGWIRTHS